MPWSKSSRLEPAYRGNLVVRGAVLVDRRITADPRGELADEIEGDI